MHLFFQVQTILKQIIYCKMNIPQKTINSFITIDKILGKMIQKLSTIKTELYRTRENFGLRKNQKIFFQHILNKQFEKINGKLTQNALLECKEGKKQEIPSKQQIQISWNVYEGYFNSICRQLEKYFKVNSIYKGIVTSPSKITNQFYQLQEWIRPSFENKQIQWFKLLYRGSEQGFSAQKFHQKCDNSKNMLVLIQTNTNRIIGGFSFNNWGSTSHGYYLFDKTNRTFIFSLTLKQKMLNTSGKESIYYNNNHGPTFGNHDIYIADQSNLNNCSSSFPAAYNNGSYSLCGPQSRNAFVGSPDGVFKTIEYEVYQVL